jgi:hypothetical protein
LTTHHSPAHAAGPTSRRAHRGVRCRPGTGRATRRATTTRTTGACSTSSRPARPGRTADAGPRVLELSAFECRLANGAIDQQPPCLSREPSPVCVLGRKPSRAGDAEQQALREGRREDPWYAGFVAVVLGWLVEPDYPETPFM